ncbi:MAG TPA: hypothetical protein ENJ18_06835 [Nannocystis exedens]|nr:hypothetical protein [Nannocystis exedens]
MAWEIKCLNEACGKASWASNIVDLIDNHRDGDGWLICSHCGERGYIEKSFELQEPGETWDPYLRAIITLGTPGETYQPFVFLVSYAPDEEPGDVWFSYYKDMRSSGGRLKLGYGPGGPPVLGTDKLVELIRTLASMKRLDAKAIEEAAKS